MLVRELRLHLFSRLKKIAQFVEMRNPTPFTYLLKCETRPLSLTTPFT
jgi:hypothetical protein